MKFVGSPKPNRKFGFWGTRSFVAVRNTSMLTPFHVPVGRRSRWMTVKPEGVNKLRAVFLEESCICKHGLGRPISSHTR
jgi:hypothetical protein